MKTLSELEKQHPEETLAARDEQIKELMASAERTAEHVANVLAGADARAERQAARIAELEAQLKTAFIDGYNLGHEDTVEGCFYWCKQGQSEKYDDYAQSLEGKE